MDYLEITHPIVTALLTIALACMVCKFHKCSTANKQTLQKVRTEITMLRREIEG